MAAARGLELRLIIPGSPCCKYDVKGGYDAASGIRVRQRHLQSSSSSNPEYRSTMYDRLEITIKDRSTTSSQSRGTRQRSQSDAVLSSSRSTPNLRKPLREIPQPPLPPAHARNDSKPYRYGHGNNSKSTVTSDASLITDQGSSKLGSFSPLTPENGQLFFRPSFHEASTGLAIDFEPVSTGSPLNPHRRGYELPVQMRTPSQDPMIFELEDTSKSPIRPRMISPTDSQAPSFLSEKPLPLIPCPKALEKEMSKSHYPGWPAKLRKKANPIVHDPVIAKYPPSAYPESRPSSSQGRRLAQSMTSHTRSPRPRTSHGSSSRSQEYKYQTPALPTKMSAKHHELPGSKSHPQGQQHMQHPSNDKKKKKTQKPFSLHIGRLHLVFGSTKQQLAQSRNPNIYQGSEQHSNTMVCQDSLGRIRYH